MELGKLKLPILLSVVFVMIGFFPMPYGFYMIIRITLCGACGYAAYLLYEKDHNGWLFLALLAVLYNPVIPVHLHEKYIWTVVNLITLGALLWSGNRVHGR